MTPLRYDPHAEWLEPDGRGGFASGTVSGERTRRYHALVLGTVDPGSAGGVPAGRYVLVNGVEAWLENAAGERHFVSTQFYQGDVVQPRGVDAITDFTYEPWPRWTFRFGEGGPVVAQDFFVVPGAALVLLSWRLLDAGTQGADDGGWQFHVRPFLSGRDYHGLQQQNPAFEFNPRLTRGRLTWKPYAAVPALHAWSDGAYQHDPLWYRNFLYRRERERGLPCEEDLASPGQFTWRLASGAPNSAAVDARGQPSTAGETAQRRAVLAFAAEGAYDASALPISPDAEPRFFDIIEEFEAGRRAAATTRHADSLARAGSAYLIRNRRGPTILAGYPWFTDWGRDTFISLRGLCLATGRFKDAGEILLRWATTVSEGMCPNRFPDDGAEPEYNSVDASLWFIIAACDYLNALRAVGKPVPAGQRDTLHATAEKILTGYRDGTRFGIRLDPADGLLACGVPDSEWALTWMDARIERAGRLVPVTPRVGKPVEIQALWLNALHAVGAPVPASRWHDLFETGLISFQRRFYDDLRGSLLDVADCDHVSGKDDDSFRPNQIFAVGGLPFSLLAPHEAVLVVAAVEEKLLTPYGLRTLAPGSTGYQPRYEGGAAERDGAYHQGTVWPWLLGPFVEAWVRVRGDTAEAIAEARRRFLDPLLTHIHDAGLGHLPEIADAESPRRPAGCPFQAWSVGEALRLDRRVLVEGRPRDIF